MQDLAARTVPEIRDAAALPASTRLGLEPAATCSPRSTARRTASVEAMTAWTALLGAVATAERPVILALHPGTRVALDEAGIDLPAVSGSSSRRATARRSPSSSTRRPC